MLKTSGITRDEAIANPDDTLKVLEFQSNYLKEENKPSSAPKVIPPPSTSDNHTPTPLPEDKPLTLSELVSKENPTTLYKNMEKIGEGYELFLI
jgi:hypothetical protein